MMPSKFFTTHKLLARDHRVRAVWAYVEALDLTPLYDRIQAVQGGPGRDAVDPRILMALWIMATTEAVSSARHLAREDMPLQPQRPDGTGVDAVVVVSSAAGVLPVVIAAISRRRSVRVCAGSPAQPTPRSLAASPWIWPMKRKATSAKAKAGSTISLPSWPACQPQPS